MGQENELITDDIIAKEALMIVENNLAITGKINRRYEKKFAVDGQKIGDHISIRYPVRWEGREGEVMVPEGAQERSTQLKIDKLIGQDLSFSNVDLTLKIDMFRERYLDTACATIANRIDQFICQKARVVPNFAGTPGVVPTTLDPFFDASVTLSDYGVPRGKRNIILSPRMEANIVNALKGLFEAGRAIAEQYMTGGLGHVIGFDWDVDQNVILHTVGPLGGTPLVNTAGQVGDSIITDGWTANTGGINRGDIVTFSTVDGINPQSREDNGTLRGFVAPNQQLADGSGNLTLGIFPAIETAGPYRNVTNAPPDNAIIKIFGSASAYANVGTRQGLAFHKEWMTAAFVDLDLPKNMEMSARAKSNKLNLSIRIVKGYDIKSNQQLCRLDVLFGAKQLYEDFCVRICS